MNEQNIENIMSLETVKVDEVTVNEINTKQSETNNLKSQYLDFYDEINNLISDKDKLLSFIAKTFNFTNQDISKIGKITEELSLCQLDMQQDLSTVEMCTFLNIPSLLDGNIILNNKLIQEIKEKNPEMIKHFLLYVAQLLIVEKKEGCDLYEIIALNEGQKYGIIMQNQNSINKYFTLFLLLKIGPSSTPSDYALVNNFLIKAKEVYEYVQLKKNNNNNK